MSARAWCFPTCKTPEKRDFMDANPARTNEDFYRNYDPWVGIGTAVILALFFLLITVKSLSKWVIRKAVMFRYKYQNSHCRMNAEPPESTDNRNTVVS